MYSETSIKDVISLAKSIVRNAKPPFILTGVGDLPLFWGSTFEACLEYAVKCPHDYFQRIYQLKDDSSGYEYIFLVFNQERLAQ